MELTKNMKDLYNKYYKPFMKKMKKNNEKTFHVHGQENLKMLICQYQKRCTNGQLADEKMLNITSKKGKANQNYKKILPHTY